MSIATEQTTLSPVVISRGALLDALASCAAIVGRHPLYAGVNICRDDAGSVSLGTCSPVGSTATVRVAAERVDGQPLSITVDHKTLTTVVRGLASGRNKTSNAVSVSLTVTPDNQLAIGANGTGITRLPGLDTPLRIPAPGHELGKVDTDVLRHLVEATAYAAELKVDPMNPVFSSVHMVIDAGVLKAEATDRHRLATASAPVSKDFGHLEAYPASAELKAVVKHLQGEVTRLASDGDALHLTSGDMRYTLARVTTASFPKTSHLCELTDSWVDVERDQLHAVAKIVQACLKTAGKNAVIVLRVPGDGSVLTLHQGDTKEHTVGDAVGAPVPILGCVGLDQVAGFTGDLEVAFASEYLLQAIEHLSEASVLRVHFHGSSRPVILCAATSDNGPRAVVMPKRFI